MISGDPLVHRQSRRSTRRPVWSAVIGRCSEPTMEFWDEKGKAGGQSLGWQLWTIGEELRRIGGIHPALDSWMAKSHPDQVRLQAFLDDLVRQLEPLPVGQDLCLHMNIDVSDPKRLTHHYDLENYLTPLFSGQRLDTRRFVHVGARKCVGGGSFVVLGRAQPLVLDPVDWTHFACTMSGNTQTKEWKTQLRAALAGLHPNPLPHGTVEVHLAWRCSDRYHSNWVWLWKPTGDAMGPVLGEPFPKKPFYPNDDRITHLGLHLTREDTASGSVEVGMWWRSSRPA